VRRAFGFLARHHDERRGAVVEARGIGGGDGAVLLEGGAQPATLRPGAGADIFVVGDDRVALAALDRDRGDLVLEPAFAARAPRPCSASGGEFVLLARA
jgi:hypothetical protein